MTKVSETKKFLVVFLEKSRLDVIAEKKRLILEKIAKNFWAVCQIDKF